MSLMKLTESKFTTCHLLTCAVAGLTLSLAPVPGTQPTALAQSTQEATSSEGVMTDFTVETQVYQEFLANDVPWYHRVTVDVQDNKATLMGQVRTLRQKQQAAAIAGTVRGVYMIDNQLKVTRSESMTAEDLVTDINRSLLINAATEAFEIDVTANDKGVATLKGTVDSYAERQLAYDVAATVHGVTQINNQINVDYNTNRPRAEVRQEILSKLKFNNLVDASNIDVRVTENDTAELSGSVSSLAELDQAVASSYVAGVVDVDGDGLKVNANQARTSDVGELSDEQIERALEAEIVLDPVLDESDITASVVNNRAMLLGTVDSLFAKHTAETQARGVTGVRRVDNYLRVSPSDPVTDRQIRERVDEALLMNDITESYEITTRVDDGVVTLTGEVDSYLEKSEAFNVAASMEGVTDVRNKLDIDTVSPWVYHDPYVYPDLAPGTYDRTDELASTETDSEIREDVESELYWSPFVDSQDIDVTVDDGVVTLAGTVEDYSERRDATKNAFDGGALAVDNDLLVAGQ